MKNKYLTMVEKPQIKKNFPNINSGDFVTIQVWVREDEKKRLQSFKGYVIAIKNRGINSSFIVRKLSSGLGVERTFQTHCQIIKEIQIEKRGKVRRAKLYYLMNLMGRSAKIKEKI